ncbi:MAG: ABC transporter permease [Acidimicrobiia bacterium]
MDAIEDLSYPLPFLLSEVGILFPIVIYVFIGELVGESPRVGGDYFTFAAIGTGVTLILQSALAGFGISLQRAQNRGQFETLLVEPLPWIYLPFAMNLWRAMLGMFNGALVLLFAGLLGANYLLSGLWQFALLALLGVVASMAIGIVAASLAIIAKRASPILSLYGMASSLLGGALFSVDQLPSWLRPFSWVIPHTYVINASRSALMSDPGSFVILPGQAIMALLVFDVVMMAVGLWLLMRSLQFARTAGILGGY